MLVGRGLMWALCPFACAWCGFEAMEIMAAAPLFNEFLFFAVSKRLQHVEATVDKGFCFHNSPYGIINGADSERRVEEEHDLACCTRCCRIFTTLLMLCLLHGRRILFEEVGLVPEETVDPRRKNPEKNNQQKHTSRRLLHKGANTLVEQAKLHYKESFRREGSATPHSCFDSRILFFGRNLGWTYTW